MTVEVLFQTVGQQAHTCAVQKQQAHTCAVQKTFRLFKQMKLYFTHHLKESKGFREEREI
jgi:hypothetical protein